MENYFSERISSNAEETTISHRKVSSPLDWRGTKAERCT